MTMVRIRPTVFILLDELGMPGLGKLPHLGACLAEHAVCSREKIPRVGGPILADGSDTIGAVLDIGEPLVDKHLAGILEVLVQYLQQVSPLAPRYPISRSRENRLLDADPTPR